MVPAQQPPQAVSADRAADLAAAAQRAAAEAPRITRDVIAVRTALGVMTDQGEVQAADVVQEAMRLVPLLPLYALAKICGCSETKIWETPAEDIVRHVLRKVQHRWVAGTIAGARRSWERLLVWCDRHDKEHHGRLDGITLSEYYAHVDAEARRKCASRAPPPPPEAGGPPPRRRQDGSKAAAGQQGCHKFLVKHWGLDLAVEAADVRFEPSRSPPAAAEAPSIAMMYDVETYLTGGNERREQGPLARPVANALGATCFTAYSVNRSEQVQFFYSEGMQHDCLYAVIRRDKHPDPSKRGPRPFWCPAVGLTGSDAWLVAFLDTLQGAEAACCAFLENDSPTGDPWQATRVYAAPMEKARIVVAKQAVYRRAAGLTAAEAAAFALHNERHFIPEIGEARREPPERLVEIGRWSGSAAQDRDMTPAQRVQHQHSLRAGALPRRYAPHAKAQRVCEILVEQMGAAADLIRRLGRAALPTRGGWGMLPARAAGA